jgi:hypothetical protein
LGISGDLGIWPSGKYVTGNGGKGDDECLSIRCKSFELVFVVNDKIGSILIRFARVDCSFANKRLSIRRTSMDGLIYAKYIYIYRQNFMRK